MSTDKMVYAVSEGSYSDYRIVAIFSSEELAQQFMNEVIGDRIETYPLNPPDADLYRQGYRVWYVSMYMDGGCRKVMYDKDRWDEVDEDVRHGIDKPFNWKDGYGPDREYIYQHLWAKSEEHAIKILNEKRAQMLAEGR